MIIKRIEINEITYDTDKKERVTRIDTIRDEKTINEFLYLKNKILYDLQEK